MLRSRIMLGILAVLVLTVIVLLMVPQRGSAAVDTSLPNPNGYDLITQAGALVKSSPKDVREQDREELTAAVRDNQAALELARKGLALPCKLPMPANMEEWDRHSQSVSSRRSLVLAFVAEGRLRTMQGDFGGAARSYLDAIKLGPAITRGGLTIDLMTGQAAMVLGADKLVEISPSLDLADAQAAAVGLKEQIRQFPPIKEIEANEDYFFAHNITLQERLALNLSGLLPLPRDMRDSVRAKAGRKLDQLHSRAAELAALAEARETKLAR